ncbi:MAG: glycerol-3-phosphate dehydrogenase [Pseudomonadota bacterium]|nr:glycerol-3-phosphate dehydrogenase [Pseudomonadota bacterium]
MQTTEAPRNDAIYDLAVVGGGVNGVGIARDAAGRGLSVLLVERNDLAAATSSASSKLIHGGLRYLEHSEFRLVRESLNEREVLWAAAPHIVYPLRFVLPVRAGMRPAWMLRAGLFLYDHIGTRRFLQPTRTLRRARNPALSPLHERIKVAFEYSDCAVDDARLVVLNAVDARERGAHIMTGWTLIGASRESALWRVEVESRQGAQQCICARALINAAGPWVEAVLGRAGISHHRTLRLVKGSHMVVPRLYAGTHAYTLQGIDGRVIFTIPYQGEFTLIGTTDEPYDGDPDKVAPSSKELDYLCRTAAQYFRYAPNVKRTVWRYAGVRPLYDDGSVNASTVTRDYVFDLDARDNLPPILSVFGGKLTTYRRLAEHALEQLLPKLGLTRNSWTATATLPGGDLPNRDIEGFSAQQVARYSFAPPSMIRRMCKAYGTRIERIMASAHSGADLGEQVAPELYEAELQYLRDMEWARGADDVLWRRSKLGLYVSDFYVQRIEQWFGDSTPTTLQETPAAR